MNIHYSDDSRSIELASFIDDDQPIDWDSAEPSTHDALERAVVSELRVVAGLTAALRRPDDHPTIVSRDEGQEPSSAAVTPGAWGPLVILEPIRARCVWNGLSRARHPGPRSGTEALHAPTGTGLRQARAGPSGGAPPRQHQSRQHCSCLRRGSVRWAPWAVDGTDPRAHPQRNCAHARHLRRARSGG